MLNLQEIRNYYFEKAGSNRYRSEDVDNFKTQAIEFIEKLIRDNNEMAKKLSAASAKLEEYKDQEDSIRSALLNAQRLGDSIVRESKIKAESVIDGANDDAQKLLDEANNKAEEIIEKSKESIAEEQQTLKMLKEEVSQFRGKLLSIYKEHIELITTLPVTKTEQPELEVERPEEADITEENEENKDKPIEQEPQEKKVPENNVKKPKYDLSFFGENSVEPSEKKGFADGKVIFKSNK